MALYYFHLKDGVDQILDPLGQEIADPSTIPDIALTEARALISADARGGVIDLDQRIEVVDEDGSLVHQLNFADAVTVRRGGHSSEPTSV